MIYNVEVLQCHLARLVAKVIKYYLYGYDCNLEEIECRIRLIESYIMILESMDLCFVNSVVISNIETMINTLQKEGIYKPCTNC